MAELAALGSAHAADLAGAVRREVVMVDVALALGGIDRVEALPLVEHAQGDDAHDLGLAALEQAGAVHAGQVARDDVQGADLVGASAVGALAGLDNHRAHGLLLERLARGGDVALPRGALLVGEQLGLDALLEFLDLAHAGLLVGVLERGGHLVEERLDALGDGRVGDVDRPLARLDGAAVQEALLGLAELGDGLLAERDGGDHVVLGDLLGARLDH